MRASTLFALTLAVLLGLGVTVAVKYSGYFNRPPEPVVAKRPDVTVLVAARNLFSGDLIDPTWVRTRVLRPEELDHYDKNKEKYVAAVPTAVWLRIPKTNIEADQPILKDDLEPMLKPETLSERLLPNMRAVNLSVPKERSAGGLIQVGEWVDVILTSNIDGGEGTAPNTHTAAIASKLRVITKRNGLWPVFAPLPEGEVHFALEANPYRAALIEFAKSRGQLSLIPVSATEQKALEEKRKELLSTMKDKPADDAQPMFVTLAEGPEYEDEEARVQAMNRGELDVSNLDLVRIFNLRTPEPPEQPITVQQFVGINRFPVAQFTSTGDRTDGSGMSTGRGSRANSHGQITSSQFRFRAPECQNCEATRKAKAQAAAAGRRTSR